MVLALQGTEWIALGSLAVAAPGVAASFGTQILALKERRDERDESARTADRQRAADALAPVLALVDDIEPNRVGINASPEVDKALTERSRQWADELRGPLLGIVASSPSPEVRAKARAVVIAVSNAVVSARWLCRDTLTHESRIDQLEVARTDHDEALAATDRLAALLRGEDPGA